MGWLLGVEEETPAPETLTERQLQQVEELTAQYLAAQPPQRKPFRALLAAGGALGLALVILAAVFCQRVLRLESQQTQLRSEIAQTTAEQMEDLRDQVQDILPQVLGGRINQLILNSMPVDYMFFSPHAINEQGIIFDSVENSSRRNALSRARYSVCLCDHSKFGKTSIFHAASVRTIDYLITDAELPPNFAPPRVQTIFIQG